MKTVIFRFGIQLVAAACLLVGASSAYAGNVNLGISLGWSFYTSAPVVYASPTHASPIVVYVSPAMVHKPYRRYRPPGPIYGKAHAAPQRHSVAPQRHNAPQYQHQQRSHR